MPRTQVSQPDSSEPDEPSWAEQSKNPRSAEPTSGLALAKCLSALAASGGGPVSTQVALDLVLNDILKRACSATSATAGAIALADKGEMVCRATTGENAPDLGIRLDTTHGLSGACVRTRQWQRSKDTETDLRVNSAVCRRLGVRSILVVPVLSAEELIGVIEIFSVPAEAFSDKDVESLQAFSQEVAENVQRALHAQTPQPPPAVVEPAPLADSPESPTFEPGSSTMELVAATKETDPQKDFSTTLLLVCVVLLALIVGWMTGRAEWLHRPAKSTVPAKQVVKSQSEPTPAESLPIPPPEQSTNQHTELSTPQPRLTGTRSDANHGLVITRDGKVVFRTPPQHPNSVASAPQQGNDAQGTTVPGLRISPEVAQQYLVTRVEPDYPEQARKDQVQGTVILDANVAKDGAVQKIDPISGNPELIQAATQAVQQWRFRPYLQSGQPQEFTTRVTVIFRLP